MVASEFHLVASEPEGLGRMRDGDLSLVVWQRLLPTRLSPAMRRWAGLEPPRLERPLFASSRWIDDALAGFAPGSARAFLEADLALHVERFGRIAGTTRVQISFGVVRGDQCRKFHVDYRRLRLITTYLGPGTEWVPEWAVDRVALGNSPECPTAANRAIVTDDRAIRRAVAGDVLLLRGHLGVVGLAHGAVHRSPPIEGSGQLRVVLVLSA